MMRRNPEIGDDNQVEEDSSSKRNIWWNREMDRCLTEALIKQIPIGQKSDRTFSRAAYLAVCDEMYGQLGESLTVSHLKNRLKTLKKDLAVFHDMEISSSDFSFNRVTGGMDAKPSVWDMHIKAHHDAKQYRYKAVPTYENLCIIFGKERPARKQADEKCYSHNASVDRITHLTVWIRFVGLKVQWFDNGILTILGNLIGTTHKIDNRTSLLIRGQYARVCIELDISKPLIHKIKIENDWYLVQYEGLHPVCFGCGIYGHDKEHCKKEQPKDNDASMEPNEKAEEAKLEAGRREAKKVEEDKIEKENKAEIAKYESFNKWNIVTNRRKTARQGGKAKQGSYSGRQNEERQSVQERSKGGLIQGRLQDKGKAPAPTQEQPKSRHINSERLNLGNNGPRLSLKEGYRGKNSEEQADPDSRERAMQAPYKKFSPRSQKLTVNGVQVDAFNQPVIFQEGKGEMQLRSKEDATDMAAVEEENLYVDMEAMEECNAQKQLEAGSAMEGVVNTLIQKLNSV